MRKYVNVKGKGNVDLYSASSQMPLTCSDMDHNTVSAFTHKHSSGCATTHIHTANNWVQLTTHLSTTKRMNGWVGHVGWYTADVYTKEVPCHIMTQARESSPVRDQCSNHCDTPLTNKRYCSLMHSVLFRHFIPSGKALNKAVVKTWAPSVTQL